MLKIAKHKWLKATAIIVTLAFLNTNIFWAAGGYSGSSLRKTMGSVLSSQTQEEGRVGKTETKENTASPKSLISPLLILTFLTPLFFTTPTIAQKAPISYQAPAQQSVQLPDKKVEKSKRGLLDSSVDKKKLEQDFSKTLEQAKQRVKEELATFYDIVTSLGEDSKHLIAMLITIPLAFISILYLSVWMPVWKEFAGIRAYAQGRSSIGVKNYFGVASRTIVSKSVPIFFVLAVFLGLAFSVSWIAVLEGVGVMSLISFVFYGWYRNWGTENTHKKIFENRGLLTVVLFISSSFVSLIAIPFFYEMFSRFEPVLEFIKENKELSYLIGTVIGIVSFGFLFRLLWGDYFVKALGKIGGKRAVPSLIKFLNDKDSDVREAAAEALGNIKDNRAVESLIKILSDEDSFVSRIAAEALGKIGKPAVESLVKSLRYGDNVVRKYAAEALGKIKDHRAVEPLIKALSDKDSDVREAAAEALGNIKDHRAVEPLIKALSDKDWSVRKAVTEYFKKVGVPAILKVLEQAYDEKDRKKIDAVEKVLEKIDSPAFIKWKKNKRRNLRDEVREKRRAKVIEKSYTYKEIDSITGKVTADVWVIERPELERVDTQAPPLSGKTLKNYAKALKHQRIEHGFIGDLSSEDKNVRKRAIKALKKMKDTPVILKVLKRAYSEKNQKKIEAIEKALEKIDKPALMKWQQRFAGEIAVSI